MGRGILATFALALAAIVYAAPAGRATDKTYRLDTAAARSFLGQYVALP